MVSAYDDLVPLPQLAQVAVPSPYLIVCNVFDPATTSAVAEAIRNSGLNLNPQDDGAVVKVPIPKSVLPPRAPSLPACDGGVSHPSLLRAGRRVRRARAPPSWHRSCQRR